MPKICIALLLALGGSASATVCSMTNGVMDKSQALACVVGLEQSCPAGTDKRRSPTSCGTDACGTFLASANSSTIDAMAQALKSCSSDVECAPYANLGANWFKWSYGMAAIQCGLEKKTDLIDATVGSCVGAVLFSMMQDSYCPKRCEKEGDGRRLEDGRRLLPKCEGGQGERSPSSCGNARCGDFLKSVSDSKIDELMADFKKCADEGDHMKGYAQFAEMGNDYLRFATLEMGKACGLSSQIPVPAANTCVGGVWIMQGMEIHCPRQCSDDGKEVRKCEKGEKERSKTSCGTTACGDFLASVDDTKIESMMTGLGKCASTPEKSPLRMYAPKGEGGSDYMKMVIKGGATDCGLSDKLKLTATTPNADTCFGAVAILSSFDTECPRQCSEDGSDGLPKCVFQKERNASTCGNTRCGDFLNSFNCNTFEGMQTGLLKCKGIEGFEWALLYANYDASFWRMGISAIASECGLKLNASVLDAACTTTSTSTPSTSASSGSSSSKTKYAANVEVTMSKAHADELTSNLTNAKSIFAKAMAKTANVPISDVTITKIYKDGVEVTQRRLSSSTDTVIKVDWEIVAPSSASPITAASLPVADLKTNVQSAAASADVPVTIVITSTPTVSSITSVAIAASSPNTTKAPGTTNGCAKRNLWASFITALLAFSTFA